MSQELIEKIKKSSFAYCFDEFGKADSFIHTSIVISLIEAEAQQAVTNECGIWCPNCGAHLKGPSIETAKAALRYAAQVFRDYEQIHAAKPDPEKAARNHDHAKICELALEELSTEGSENG